MIWPQIPKEWEKAKDGVYMKQDHWKNYRRRDDLATYTEEMRKDQTLDKTKLDLLSSA